LTLKIKELEEIKKRYEDALEYFDMIEKVKIFLLQFIIF